MDITLAGTGGSDGWPQPGCPCASCSRARSSGTSRAPSAVIVDGVLRLPLIVSQPAPARPAPGPPERPRLMRAPSGYQLRPMRGGLEVTGPDGGRLLVASRPGAVPAPPPGARPYDVVLLDLLGSPAQLGRLRHDGLLASGGTAAVLFADHRVTSAEELARWCGYWDAVAPADGDVLGTGRPAGASQPAGTSRSGRPQRVLVLGGARSGKSRHAELRLAGDAEVTYLASGPYPAGQAHGGEDLEWQQRVAAHQARRPGWWRTVECPDAASVLARASGAVLFDGASTWLAAVMAEAGAWEPGGGAAAEARIAARVDGLIAALRQTRARVITVSDETGSGVVPATASGRAFRDQLGWLNQRLAAECEETVLMVAGRPVILPG